MGKSKSVLLILIACILIISLAGCSLLPHSTTNVSPTSTTTSTTNAPLPSNSSFNVYFIDVGQGDSILIDQGQTEVLIDGGSQSPGITDFLRNYVDGDLEVMIATHPHADHIGGLIAVLDAFKVDQIWYNGDTSTSATYSTFMSKVKSEGAQEHIATLDFEGKRQALDMLDITVWLDGGNVDIAGVIYTEGVIVTTPS